MAPPEPGASVAVAPGVRWARIPLPIELSHINVWLIEAAQGCILVDTGMACALGKQAWETIERDVLQSRSVQAVFVTHIHPDHMGLAAWLQERFGVPVLMSAHTHELARLLLGGGQGRAAMHDAQAFCRMHGVADPAQVIPMFSGERFARMTSGLPSVQRCVSDGEVLQWSPHQWTALQTDGHAQGHLCLWSPAAGALISGDQVLPTISSNVSYGWHSSDANPLDSYLASLQRLAQLPEDTLVLPSHGVPFRGLRPRIEDLVGHHREQLDRLQRLCTEPRTACELLPAMFRRELQGLHWFLALGETLAHLEYLVHAGQLERHSAAGLMRYAAVKL